MTDLREDDRQPLSLPDFLARDTGLGLRRDDGESIDVVAVVARLHELVIDRVDLAALLGAPTDEGREIATEAIQVLMPSAGVPNIESARARVTRMVLDEIFGLGPLQPLLDDPTVQEIMVNAPDTVYTESDGILLSIFITVSCFAKMLSRFASQDIRFSNIFFTSFRKRKKI